MSPLEILWNMWETGDGETRSIIMFFVGGMVVFIAVFLLVSLVRHPCLNCHRMGTFQLTGEREVPVSEWTDREVRSHSLTSIKVERYYRCRLCGSMDTRTRWKKRPAGP